MVKWRSNFFIRDAHFINTVFTHGQLENEIEQKSCIFRCLEQSASFKNTYFTGGNKIL